MTKCFADSRCESEHGGHGEMLHAFKGFDDAQGLVCLLHWGRVLDRNSYFGCRSLDDFYGYEYVGLESSSISELQAVSRTSKDFSSKSSDADWKWILYQQQASLSDFVNPTKSIDRYALNTVMDPGPNVKGDVKQTSAELSFASVFCATSKVEACPHAGINKPQRVHMIQPLESNVAISSLKGSLSWHATNSKQFTATIPRSSHAHAGVCILPPSSVSCRESDATISQRDYAHTESYDVPPLVSSLKRGEDCVVNECVVFHEDREVSLERKRTADVASLGRTPSCELLSGVKELSVMSASLQEPSVHDRSSDHFDDEKAMLEASQKKCFGTKKHADEILGEALCHAQTRARLAEKLAAQALQERERLAHLLLREAWTSCTYKQRVHALELENRLLKRCLNIDIKVWTGSESMYLRENTARTSWKLAQKHHPFQNKRNLYAPNSQQGKGNNSSRSWKEKLLLSCALGLAFILGVSIAGAGLMIGWSMGWILFS